MLKRNGKTFSIPKKDYYGLFLLEKSKETLYSLGIFSLTESRIYILQTYFLLLTFFPCLKKITERVRFKSSKDLKLSASAHECTLVRQIVVDYITVSKKLSTTPSMKRWLDIVSILLSNSSKMAAVSSSMMVEVSRRMFMQKQVFQRWKRL